MPTSVGGLTFASFLGGSGDDGANAMSVGANGEFVVGGYTTSADFPSLNAVQSKSGASDGFITRFDSSNAINFSTFLGGSGADSVIALDISPLDGRIIAAGMTQGGFPVTGGAIQPNFAGGLSDGFVARFGASGAGYAPDFATYLGGSGDDWVSAIDVDSAGGIYLTGTTTSGSSFPRVNFIPFAETRGGGSANYNAFIAHMFANGNLDFSTLLGGSGSDTSEAIIAAAGGGAWAAGTTESSNFPLASPFVSNFFGPKTGYFVHVGTPPALISVVSRKIHGTVGPFEIGIDVTKPILGNVSVEPRSNETPHAIIFRFDQPVISGQFQANGPSFASGKLGSTNGWIQSAISGNDIVLRVSGIPNTSRVSLYPFGINGFNVAYPANIGFLLGDVNGTGVVTAGDISAVKATSGKPLDNSNFRKDINADGKIAADDLSATKARAGQKLGQ